MPGLCGLPDDLVQQIAALLKVQDLCNLRSVSKRFLPVCDFDSLWQRLYMQRWGEPPHSVRLSGWKDEFKAKDLDDRLDESLSVLRHEEWSEEQLYWSIFYIIESS